MNGIAVFTPRYAGPLQFERNGYALNQEDLRGLNVCVFPMIAGPLAGSPRGLSPKPMLARGCHRVGFGKNGRQNLSQN